jgi:hypothetical protein
MGNTPSPTSSAKPGKVYKVWCRITIEECNTETDEHRDVELDEETGEITLAYPEDNEVKIGEYDSIQLAAALQRGIYATYRYGK